MSTLWREVFAYAFFAYVQSTQFHCISTHGWRLTQTCKETMLTQFLLEYSKKNPNYTHYSEASDCKNLVKVLESELQLLKTINNVYCYTTKLC